MVGASGRRTSRAGFRLLSSVAIFAICVGATGVHAVVTYDLLQDTPRTREVLKEELTATVPAGVAAAPSPAAAGRGELEAIWFARERYLEIGEVDKAQLQLQLLWEKAMERGIRNLPEYGTVLVREAERRMRTKDYDQAARALGFARKLAPDELPVYTTGALLALRRNPFDLGGAWDEFSQAIQAIKRSFRIQAWLLANAVLTLTAGLAFFFAFTTAVFFAVNAGRLAHDIRERIGFGTPRARTILSWLAVAAPALVGLSPWWWLMLAGLAIWPYLGKAQQAILAAGALFVLALPAVVRETGSLVTLPGRPLLETVVRVREGHWAEADYRELKKLAEKGAAGVPGVTALGLAARRLGHLDEAEAAYRAGIQATPDDPVLWNNLGTVALARRDLAQAVAHFSKASGLAPGYFPPHYNLGVAYREDFKFAEGEAASRRAAEIDAEAVAFYAGLDASRLKGFTVDGVPTTASLWAVARVRDEAGEAAEEVLWESFMLGPSAAAWPAVAVGFIILGGALGAWRLRGRLADECERCGRLYCLLCQPGARGRLCSQCHHIFVKKEGVDAKARVQKMGQIKTWRRVLRVRHLVCAALAPGGGHLSAGRYGVGLLFLMPASFFEARVMLGRGAFPSPWSLSSAASSTFVTIGAVLFGLWWLGSFLLATRLEE